MNWLSRIFSGASLHHASVQLADSKPPVAPPFSDSMLQEQGASGTPIFHGYLTDPGEHNAALSGLSGFPTYEKMRRSDGQVAATVLAMKLPILSADWTIATPPGANAIEKEAAAFVRQCLLEDVDLLEAVENALLMLDFGCAAHEDIWYVDGNRIRLRKMAARLPLTFSRWLTAPGSEELTALEQMLPDGRTATIPAEKLALFTFQREGNNYAGRSLLRPMYQHWFIKSNLYKIDAIAQERNGLGIPVVTMGPDAKKQDADVALKWVQQITAHEKAGLRLPHGWTFELKGVNGGVRDPKESIAHHNEQISKAGLTMFMDLGQSASGNRSLGSTMSDFFMLSLEATAQKIANVLNWSTVARLVDYNFSGVRRYPAVVPQRIMATSFPAVRAALQELSQAGLIQPDDELEDWLRKKIGAPPRRAADGRQAQWQ